MILADWLVVAALCLNFLAVGLVFTRRAGRQVGGPPPGFRLLQDPAYAWGELVRLSRLPAGFTGVLVPAAGALEKNSPKSRSFQGRRTAYRSSSCRLPPRHRLLFGARGHDQLPIRRRLDAFYARRLGIRPVRVLVDQKNICDQGCFF